MAKRRKKKNCGKQGKSSKDYITLITAILQLITALVILIEKFRR